MDELAIQLANRFIESFKKVLIPGLTKTFEEAELIFSKVSEKKKLPTVLVLGPKNDQQSILNKEFFGVLNLKYVEASSRSSLVTEKAKNAQCIVSWTNFVPHEFENHARNSGTHLIRVAGGMDTLSQKLLELSVSPRS